MFVEDLDSWPATVPEDFRIDHYCGQELQESGAIWAVTKARSRLLCVDPVRFPTASRIGIQIGNCCRASRCRLPYCTRCRGPINNAERERGRTLFAGINSKRLRFVTVNLAFLDLDHSPAAFPSLVTKIKRKIQNRFVRYVCKGAGLTAQAAGMRLLGGFELTAVRAGSGVKLLFHLHGLVDMGKLDDWDLGDFLRKFAKPLDNGDEVHGRYKGANQVHVIPLKEGRVVADEVANIAGYTMKVSLRVTHDDLNGPILRSLVEHLETIRGRGLVGLRFKCGFSETARSMSVQWTFGPDYSFLVDAVDGSMPGRVAGDNGPGVAVPKELDSVGCWDSTESVMCHSVDLFASLKNNKNNSNTGPGFQYIEIPAYCDLSKTEMSIFDDDGEQDYGAGDDGSLRPDGIAIRWPLFHASPC